MNLLFINNNERKRRRCDKNIHKAIQIPVDIYQINKSFFVTVQPKYDRNVYHSFINLSLTL